MQLLKWLFAILVLLNIVVFANVVTQKMNGKRHEQNPAVVAVPIGLAGEEGSANVGAAPPTHVSPSTGGRVGVPAAPVRRDTSGQVAPTAPLPQNTPSCMAQITLPEDAYHRLKNFINGWNNSVSRNVVENKQSGKGNGLQYQVLVAGASEDTLQQLRSSGINANQQGGSISLGVFPDIGKANATRDRAIAAGVSGVIVSERGSAQTALTSAQYTVTFRNIDGVQAQKISDVLGRYGRLQRSACPQ